MARRVYFRPLAVPDRRFRIHRIARRRALRRQQPARPQPDPCRRPRRSRQYLSLPGRARRPDPPRQLRRLRRRRECDRACGRGHAARVRGPHPRRQRRGDRERDRVRQTLEDPAPRLSLGGSAAPGRGRRVRGLEGGGGAPRRRIRARLHRLAAGSRLRSGGRAAVPQPRLASAPDPARVPDRGPRPHAPAARLHRRRRGRGRARPLHRRRRAQDLQRVGRHDGGHARARGSHRARGGPAPHARAPAHGALPAGLPHPLAPAAQRGLHARCPARAGPGRGPRPHPLSRGVRLRAAHDRSGLRPGLWRGRSVRYARSGWHNGDPFSRRSPPCPGSCAAA